MINATQAREKAETAMEMEIQARKDAARDYCETVIAAEIENAANTGQYSMRHVIKAFIPSVYVREYLTNAGYRVDRVDDSFDKIMIDWHQYRDDR